MKKVLFFGIFLSFTSVIFSQDFRIGGELSAYFSRKDADPGVGPGFILQYSIPSLPLTVQGRTSFHFSSLDVDTKNVGYGGFTVFNYGISVLYYPVEVPIEPFLSLGIYYNHNQIESHDMHPDYYISELENSTSFEITGGLHFDHAASSSFLLEAGFIFNKPEYIYLSSALGAETIKTRFDMNSVVLRLRWIFSVF